MKRPPQATISPERQAGERDYARRRAESFIALLLAIASVAALLWYYAHNELLLYGDAVAHINIARRVLDTRSWLSSFFQLGTVWLPLQHVAMLPFVWNDVLWRSGIAGAVPSMMAYMLGGVGIFRLVYSRLSLLPACVATAIYALNPNLLYMQTTAMNEPIFLAFFVWSVVYFDEMLCANASVAQRGPSGLTRQQAMERCGVALAGGAWTRYDGWFVTAVIGTMVFGFVVSWWRGTRQTSRRRALTKSLIEFLLINALVPVFWLAYNHRVSGRAMDWANGPYSAKAIAARTTRQGAAPYPGQDHPATAAVYFLKAAQLTVGTAPAGRILLVVALAGSAVAIRRLRQYGRWLLLWLPLLFYAFSIAYGSVPIFIPAWWPFSYYNVRYGLELLPVFCVFPVLLTSAAAEFLGAWRRELALWTLLSASVAAGYLSAWAEVPITLREARANSRTRLAMEEALANYLVRVPKNATLLMYQGVHVGALQRAGIPLKRVITEVNHPDWEWALLDPAHQADVIIAFDGDPVWMAAREHRNELTQVESISVPEQARSTVYVSKR